MTLEQQLHDAVVADPGLSAILGSRFFLVQLPQNPTYPSAVYQRVSTVPIYTHSTLGAGQASVGWSRFQITAWFNGASGGAAALDFFSKFMAFLQTFNAYQLPASPFVIAQAPNFLVGSGFRLEWEPQPQQPLAKAMLDIKIYWQNQ